MLVTHRNTPAAGNWITSGNWISGNTRGYALIEFCVVLPLLLLIVLGTIDAGSVMHSYNAAREGVKAAIRCAAPTDGLCAGAPPKSGERYFELSLTETEPEYLIETVNYSGSASWLKVRASVYNAEAEVLDQALFNLSGEAPAIAAQLVKYPAKGSIKYVLRKGLFPRIGGDPLRPTFTDDSGEAYPPRLKKSLAGIVGQTRSSKKVDLGAAELTLAPPPNIELGSGKTRPCFLPQAKAQELKPEFSKPCSVDGSWPWVSGQVFDGEPFIKPVDDEELKSFTYVVIHVTGRVDEAATEAGAVGKVSLAINQDGKRRDLGGRTFSRESSGSFVVRGAPINSYSPEAGRYEEYELHQAIRVRFNSPFSLKFELESLNGRRVGWRGGTVQVFGPSYEPGEFASACTDRIFKSDRLKNGACRLDLSSQGSLPASKAYANEPITLSLDQPEPIGSLLNIGCGSTSGQFSERLQTALTSLGDARPAEDYQSLADVSLKCAIEPHEESLACPDAGKSFPEGAANVGVDKEVDSDGFISESAEAASICSPFLSPDFSSRADLQVSNVHWSVKSSPIDAPTEFIYRPKSCADLTPRRDSLPSEWLRYNKINFSLDENRTVYAALPAVDGRSVDSTLALPEFSCGAFSKESLDIKDALSGAPLQLEGPVSDLGCGWMSEIRLRLREAGIPDFAEVSVGKSGTGRFENSSAPPIDSCASYQIIPDGKLVMRPLGRYREGEFPAVCAEAAGRCRATAAKVSDSSAPEPDLVRASRSGYEAIQAAIPRARSSCSGPYCVKVTVREDHGAINAESLIATPLFILGKHPVQVSYSEKRLLEAAIVR